MSAMSDLDLQLQEVSRCMVEPRDDVGQALRSALAAIDTLVILANQPSTRGEVLSERKMIGKLLQRCETLVSSALIEEPGKLRIIGRA